jgi:uncharacterized protein
VISAVLRIVRFCHAHAKAVAAGVLIATVAMGGAVLPRLSVNADVSTLISPDLPWRQDEAAVLKAFPQMNDLLVAVIDGKTAEEADAAAARLYQSAAARGDLFHAVWRPDARPFFQKNGLLFLPVAEVQKTADQIIASQAFLGSLAADPSLRGLFGTLNLALQGIEQGQTDFAALEKPLGMIAASLNGQPGMMSWQNLLTGRTPQALELRRFVLMQPILDFASMTPGAAATAAVRDMIRDQKLDAASGVKVRLTGSVPLTDEEFASLEKGSIFSLFLSVVLVGTILFLALRAVRLIVPIVLTLGTGLVLTTVFATLAVGSLNMISVAFAVMFVGIAVDFGIQFGVRYRDQRFHHPDAGLAMELTAGVIGRPLTLAAFATAIGFLSFIPTPYTGVAELGIIAGAGMLIAFALNITLLPALLTLFHPKPELEAIGFTAAAPLDQFLIRRRGPVLATSLVLAVAGIIVSALYLRFDFDPIHLKDPKTESVSTFLDLMKSPDTTPNTVTVLQPSLVAAKEMAAKLDKVAEVDHTVTLSSFIPEDQDVKLAILQDVSFLLGPTLAPPTVLDAPDAAAVIAAMQAVETRLTALVPRPQSADDFLTALRFGISQLQADPSRLPDLDHRLLGGFRQQLQALTTALSAEPVTLETIPDDLRREWVAADGSARVEVYPKGDSTSSDVLKNFVAAVRKLAPHATGTPVSIQESAATVSGAFIQAGILAVLAISILLLAVLRRVVDVVRVLAPLLLAAILTLATSTLIGIDINFANVIALPLLLGLGVSFAIYFVVNWRSGMANPLQSSMARAVLFSAATTMVAFGSLSLSAHPGTAEMGILLTLALTFMVLSTILFLPALLGLPPAANSRDGGRMQDDQSLLLRPGRNRGTSSAG